MVNEEVQGDWSQDVGDDNAKPHARLPRSIWEGCTMDSPVSTFVKQANCLDVLEKPFTILPALPQAPDPGLSVDM